MSLILPSERERVAAREEIDAMAMFYNSRLYDVLTLVVCGVLGVLGNSMVLLVYWRARRLHATRLLIVVISMLDFFTALVAVPINLMYSMFWFEIDHRLYFCQILHGITVLLMSPGLLLLFVVAFVRFVLVRLPHLLPLIETKMKYVIFFSLFIGLVKSALNIYLYGFHTRSDTVLVTCYIDDSHVNDWLPFIYFYVHFYSSIVLVAVLTFIYLIILRQVYVHTHLLGPRFNIETIEVIGKRMNEIKFQSKLPSPADCQEPPIMATSPCQTPQEIQSEKNMMSPNTNSSRMASDTNNNYETESSGSKNQEKSKQISEDSSFEAYTQKLVRNRERNKRRKSFKPVKKRKRTLCKKLCANMSVWKKTAIDIVFIIATYIITYMPWIGISLNVHVHVNQVYSKNEANLTNFGNKLSFIGCALNPLIYSFVDSRFRGRVRAEIRRARCSTHDVKVIGIATLYTLYLCGLCALLLIWIRLIYM